MEGTLKKDRWGGGYEIIAIDPEEGHERRRKGGEPKYKGIAQKGEISVS